MKTLWPLQYKKFSPLGSPDNLTDLPLSARGSAANTFSGKEKQVMPVSVMLVGI